MVGERKIPALRGTRAMIPCGGWPAIIDSDVCSVKLSAEISNDVA
jgi:hypothetical protein